MPPMLSTHPSFDHLTPSLRFASPCTQTHRLQTLLKLRKGCTVRTYIRQSWTKLCRNARRGPIVGDLRPRADALRAAGPMQPCIIKISTYQPADNRIQLLDQFALFSLSALARVRLS